MSEKIYVGKGKKIEFSNGGSKIHLTLTLDGMKDFFEKYGFTARNSGKKMIKLDICEMKNPDEWENTHYATIDTYKPNQAPIDDPEEEMPF